MTNITYPVSYSLPFRLTVQACKRTLIDHRHDLYISRPIWRIYRYPDGGAGIVFREQTVFPQPDEVLIVPPNTAVKHLLEAPCWHHWIHIGLGFPYNAVKGDVFLQKLNDVEKFLFAGVFEEESIPSLKVAKITALIAHLVSRLPSDCLPSVTADQRISRVLEVIHEAPGADLNNGKLAELAGMSCNAFTRLFKETVSVSPRAYILERRLDEASSLLTYSNQSLDHIAEQCGFSDRGYMTRVFTQKRGTPPARYRRMSRMD